MNIPEFACWTFRDLQNLKKKVWIYIYRSIYIYVYMYIYLYTSIYIYHTPSKKVHASPKEEKKLINTGMWSPVTKKRVKNISQDDIEVSNNLWRYRTFYQFEEFSCYHFPVVHLLPWQSWNVAKDFCTLTEMIVCFLLYFINMMHYIWLIF